MLRLIIFLLLLVASVWLGLEVIRHPGYLLVVYHPWMVQMPLWFALIAFVLILVVFYIFIDSIDRLQFLWFRLKNWLRIHREHKSYSKTQHGLTLLIEGRWQKAERLLLAGVNQSFEPLMNYLGAAKAAQELGAFERRDSYLQKAYHVAPHASLAIGLTRAELELGHDQLEQAAATLTHLRQASPRHPRVLKLLEKVYVRLGDWKDLQAMIPAMRKAKLINTEQSEQFEKNIYSEMFHGAQHKTLDDIHHLWEEIPRQVKRNPDVVFAYVERLRVFPSTNNEMEELIRKTLKHTWQPTLVEIYGTLTFNHLNRQLVIAGAWLKIYGPKPELLLLLGKLCMRVQLWGKAKDYFEKCLQQGPHLEATLEYGKLLEQLGDSEEALQCYREGLAQVVEATQE